MDKVFRRVLATLNEQQKKAVETIDGPVLVIAGPGTGKTQLLALRAAQILQTDSTMLPGNILCLTFTDAAANNMRERLVKFIGQDAYRVAIHTFNSFGAYIMGAYPEFFYDFREVKTADELTTHNLLEQILAALPGDHPLAAHGADGQFFAQSQLRNFIGDAKRADLSATQLRQVLADNHKTYDKLLPVLRQFWPDNMRARDALAKIDNCVANLTKLKEATSKVEAVTPLQKMLVESLTMATKLSEQETVRGRTKPFTAWKDDWLEFDEDRQLVFKGQKHHEKLLAAVEIYEKYEQALKDQGLADFNDQIMWVLSAMRAHSDLRYNLQERFQYVMIDEFQDTNRSQLLMAQYLTDAPEHEGRPNILVVGDDDQAVFRFQGADIGNVGLFESYYKEPEQIWLKANYRSGKAILDGARSVAKQILSSLENQKNIDKELLPLVKSTGDGLVINQFEHEGEHYSYVAEQIKRKLAGGVAGKDIAVLARERPQLDSLVPYLRHHQIPINYERRENVLEQPHIINLLDMARLVLALSEKNLDLADELFARVLSSEMWGIAAPQIRALAIATYKGRKLWLEEVDKFPECAKVADFFTKLAGKSSSMPMEQILDELIGTSPSIGLEDQDDELSRAEQKFFSPYRDFYFKDELLAGKPAEYLTLLSHLNTLRQHLRNYQQDARRTLYISDLLAFVDSYSRADNLAMLDRSPHNENENAVQLMTIHKAKGQEFDTVFVLGLENDVWSRTGSRRRFSYPPNLKPIRPSDNQEDDGLRLLFVAMTRAKNSLYLNYFTKDEQGGPHQPYSPLLAIDSKVNQPKVKIDAPSLVAQYEQRWLVYHGSDDAALEAYFDEQLANYQLSVTDMNNFLDVSLGGPSFFFMQNLLHFPSGKSPMAIYGSLIHAALSRAHLAVIETGQFDSATVINGFKSDVETQPLSDADKQYYIKRGADNLSTYFAKSGDSFSRSQLIDVDFKNQNVVVGQARLKGFIDRLDVDKNSRTLTVSDYKTGRASANWKQSGEDSKKIKLHRYRNQLLFYKLLLDGAADWGQKGWRVERALLRYVEPDDYGKIRQLELVYDEAELETFKKLVQAVWAKIMALDFSDTSAYPPTLTGIRAFEADLLK